ncbi:MAG TPA: thioesterase family protein [Myxococcales bacterium]|nr:thioesterase family protein [Myxococcales bacterium]
MDPYRVRVIYGDTDQMGVVYYANYLRFFEGARAHYIRGLGMSYGEIESRGILLPVYEATVNYLKSARYDDLVRVDLSQTHTRVKIRFEYKVHREGDNAVLALGHTVHVCVGREGRPTRAPDWLIRALDAEEPASPATGGVR